MVKNTALYIITVFLFSTLALVSCKDGKSMFSAGNGIEFDTLTVRNNSHLDDDTIKPSCNLSVDFVYPVASGKIDVSTLQQLFVENVLGHSYAGLSPEEAMQKYTENYVQNYRNDAKAFSENMLEEDPLNSLTTVYEEESEEDGEEKRPDIFYSYYETLADSIVFDGNNILSFQVKQSTNKGGNASYESFRNYVVNLNTGNLLTENDIFTAGYDVQLRTLFIAALIDQNKVENVRDLADLGYFGIEEITPNKNFLIDKKGITYIFNKGEYSAYQLDAPVIFLPYDAIRPILRENTVVSKLAEN